MSEDVIMAEDGTFEVCDKDSNPILRVDEATRMINGTLPVLFPVVAYDTDCAVGDDLYQLPVIPEWNGLNIVDVYAFVWTPGTGSTMNVGLERFRGGSPVEVLSTLITMDPAVYSAHDGVVNTSNDDLQTGDYLVPSVDQVHTTAAKGLWMEIVMRLPDAS